MRQSIGALILLLMMLVSCTPPTSMQTSTASNPTDIAELSAYPAATAIATVSPYPYPPMLSVAPTLEPSDAQPIEVNDSIGAIRGTLLDTEGKPIAGISVFLASIVDSPSGKLITFSLESQRGSTDDRGLFVIRNVAGGTYSLAIWTPATNFLIPAPNGGENSAIEVKVVNGQITDLGEIRVRRP